MCSSHFTFQIRFVLAVSSITLTYILFPWSMHWLTLLKPCPSWRRVATSPCHRQWCDISRTHCTGEQEPGMPACTAERRKFLREWDRPSRPANNTKGQLKPHTFPPWIMQLAHWQQCHWSSASHTYQVAINVTYPLNPAGDQLQCQDQCYHNHTFIIIIRPVSRN